MLPGVILNVPLRKSELEDDAVVLFYPDHTDGRGRSRSG